ncbi:hypothetical protein [Paenibacillus pabuli]
MDQLVSLMSALSTLIAHSAPNVDQHALEMNHCIGYIQSPSGD